ncbi:TetR/AcrR family transcriptional regulator [candidate division KSB1 bacterium]|nr:TetR/AcrR family transcriptional regulator [candidate division KSB1 bacterium]
MDTRERILNSAKLVFSQRGREGARMQEIADLAGVNKAMLFYYFTSKDKLYEDVLRNIMTHLFMNINNVTTSAVKPESKIEKIVETYVDLMNKNPYIPGIIIAEVASGADTLKKLLAELKDSAEFTLPQNIKQIFIHGKQDHRFRGIDVEQTILSILGMCVIYFIGKPLVNDILKINGEDESKFLRRRVKHIIDLLENGILIRK